MISGLFKYKHIPVVVGSAYEVKAKNKGLYLSSNTYQVKGHIDNLTKDILII